MLGIGIVNVENLGFKSNTYEPFFAVNVLSGAIMKPLSDLHEQTLPSTNHPTFRFSYRGIS